MRKLTSFSLVEGAVSIYGATLPPIKKEFEQQGCALKPSTIAATIRRRGADRRHPGPDSQVRASQDRRENAARHAAQGSGGQPERHGSSQVRLSVQRNERRPGRSRAGDAGGEKIFRIAARGWGEERIAECSRLRSAYQDQQAARGPLVHRRTPQPGCAHGCERRAEADQRGVGAGRRVPGRLGLGTLTGGASFGNPFQARTVRPSPTY